MIRELAKQLGNARHICISALKSQQQTKVDRLTHRRILSIFAEFDFPSEIQTVTLTSLSRALTNVSAGLWDKNLIQSRIPKEGMEKVETRTSAPRKEKKRECQGGLAKQGLSLRIWIGFTWSWLSSGTVLKSAERASNCQKCFPDLYKCWYSVILLVTLMSLEHWHPQPYLLLFLLQKSVSIVYCPVLVLSLFSFDKSKARAPSHVRCLPQLVLSAAGQLHSSSSTPLYLRL